MQKLELRWVQHPMNVWKDGDLFVFHQEGIGNYLEKFDSRDHHNIPGSRVYPAIVRKITGDITTPTKVVLAGDRVEAVLIEEEIFKMDSETVYFSDNLTDSAARGDLNIYEIVCSNRLKMVIKFEEDGDEHVDCARDSDFMNLSNCDCIVEEKDGYFYISEIFVGNISMDEMADKIESTIKRLSGKK